MKTNETATSETERHKAFKEAVDTLSTTEAEAKIIFNGRNNHFIVTTTKAFKNGFGQLFLREITKYAKENNIYLCDIRYTRRNGLHFGGWFK